MNKAPENTTPFIAFASGKGGVGKTSLCLNIASLLAKKGKRVLVLDGDFGMANIDVQLGITPKHDLTHVLAGSATLEEAIVETGRGFHIVAGRSGAMDTDLMTVLEQSHILNQIKDLSDKFDVVFIDVAAGIDGDVLAFTNYADHTLLVTTPDPSSITDAYAVIKLLWKKYGRNNIQVLINQAGGEEEGRQTFKKLHTAANQFLQIEIPLFGIVEYDRQYSAAVKMQKLSTQAFPTTKSTTALERVADKVKDLISY